MNVLSLFDGISCGRVALENLGIKIDRYYTSEIDKDAIAISDFHYPDNEKLGDVNYWEDWEDWEIDWASIDLIFAGFPCQSWSANGKLQGIEDAKGQLVYPMLHIIEKVRSLNPGVKFILENVKMKTRFQDFLTGLIGVEPILLNSGRVSAQNRERLYWTNIETVEFENADVVFKDIMEDSPQEVKGGQLVEYFEDKEGKLTSRGLCHIGTADINGMDSIKRVYHADGKSPTLQTTSGGNREAKFATSKTTWRKITPLEAERLQTLPDNYTQYGIKGGATVPISNSKRFFAVGNGWTVSIIEKLLEGMV